MYIANHYIGGRFTPGEIVPDDLPREKLDWWLRSGAIREVAPDAEPAEAPDNQPSLSPAAPLTSPPEGETKEAIEAEVEAMEEAEEEAEDEIDEEAEVPEIDIMDGLVQAEEEEPKKPARTRKGGKTN